MSTVIAVSSKQLYGVLADLSYLFPKGSAEMPIGLHIGNNKLHIVCLQGCVYQSNIPLGEDADNVTVDTTVLYHDIAALLDTNSDVILDFNPAGLDMQGADFTASFQTGYSAVEMMQFQNYSFKSISNPNYLDGLKLLTRTGLDKLYHLNEPVLIEGDISLQKYPNTWVQVRTSGLPFTAVLDTDHVKLLTRFKPTAVSDDLQGSLIFKNQRSVLQLPSRNNNSRVTITELMQDLDTCTTVGIEHYADRIRVASKVTTSPQCKLTVYEDGIKTTIHQNNAEISVSSGDTTSKVLKACHMPLQVWLAFLKCLDADRIQVLTGGEKLCLRTQSTIIVTHALL